MSLPISSAAPTNASAPPPYTQPTRTAGARISQSQSSVGPPIPFFDSILRAAPAFDYENEEDIGHDNDSASSSTASLAEQLTQSAVSDWSSTLIPHLEQHASLHAFLDANERLPENLENLKNRIHINLGKRTSLTTRVTRLQLKLHQLQLESDKRSKLLYRPKKRREFLRQVDEITSELEPIKEQLHKYEEEVARDQQLVTDLSIETEESAKVSAQLDAIDHEVFGGPTLGHQDEDLLEQQYHILTETIRRLQTSISSEARCQTHLNKAHSLSLTLIKELLAGLNIGIEIGVPTNTKHKTQLWRGNSPTHSANRSRGHVLRAKTIAGDIHTHYLLARATQRRVAILPRMRVIDLVRLPGMTARNVTDEQVSFISTSFSKIVDYLYSMKGLHRSLESSYSEAKISKAHIEGQQHLSRQRQASLRKHIKELRQESKNVWLELRKKRREIVEEYKRLHGEELSMTRKPDDALSLPPYKRNLLSSSVIGFEQTNNRGGDAIPLPPAFRKKVDHDSMARSRVIVRQVAIEVGGTIEDDKVEDHERITHDEEIPGIELTFGY